jgi:hypothetical protein
MTRKEEIVQAIVRNRAELNRTRKDAADLRRHAQIMENWAEVLERRIKSLDKELLGIEVLENENSSNLRRW